MTNPVFAPANGFVGLGLEAVRGTAAASPIYLPVKDPKTSPMITWLKDEGLRGSPVATFDQVPGVRHDEFEFKGDVQLDTFPLLVIAALGAADAISGSGPYTHLDGLLNNVLGSQPPSLTVQDFNGAICQQMTAAQVDNLELTFAADAALTFTAKCLSNPSTVIGRPSPTFGTEPIIPNWSAATTINSVAVTTLEEFSCKIDRAVESAHTGGSQGPYANVAGPCVVTGKATFVLNNVDDPLMVGGSEWSSSGPAGLSRLHLPMSVVWTDPVTGHSITLQMSDVQFTNPVIERSKKYVEISADYEANGNTTDAVSGGYAPIQVTTINAHTPAYAGS